MTDQPIGKCGEERIRSVLPNGCSPARCGKYRGLDNKKSGIYGSVMTSLHSSEIPSRLVRLFIDSDGASYGDEMERVRYYEAHSALFQMQMIISLLVGAGAMAASNERSANVIYWVVLLPQFANFIALGYLSRRGVRVVELSRRARRRPPFWIFVAAAAFFVVVRAVKRTSVMKSGDILSFGAGVGATVVLVVVVGYLAKRRSAKRQDS